MSDDEGKITLGIATRTISVDADGRIHMEFSNYDEFLSYVNDEHGILYKACSNKECDNPLTNKYGLLPQWSFWPDRTQRRLTSECKHCKTKRHPVTRKADKWWDNLNGPQRRRVYRLVMNSNSEAGDDE